MQNICVFPVERKTPGRFSLNLEEMLGIVPLENLIFWLIWSLLQGAFSGTSNWYLAICQVTHWPSFVRRGHLQLCELCSEWQPTFIHVITITNSSGRVRGSPPSACIWQGHAWILEQDMRGPGLTWLTLALESFWKLLVDVLFSPPKQSDLQWKENETVKFHIDIKVWKRMWS